MNLLHRQYGVVVVGVVLAVGLIVGWSKWTHPPAPPTPPRFADDAALGELLGCDENELRASLGEPDSIGRHSATGNKVIGDTTWRYPHLGGDEKTVEFHLLEGHVLSIRVLDDKQHTDRRLPDK